MDRYLYVQSNRSDDFYSDNEPYRFKVHLHMPLTLPGYWRVGLVELHAEQLSKSRSKSSEDKTLYIYSDVCSGSIVDGREQSLLRCVDPNTTNGWNYTFDHVFYLPVTTKQLTEFEVYIKDSKGGNASFLKEPLRMVLHFKPYPFYSDYESI